MFKCSAGNLFYCFLLVFSTSAFADVYKWKDANGKIHYGDVPHMAGTAKVKTDEQTEDQIANGERIRAETGSSNQGAARDPRCDELRGEMKKDVPQFGKMTWSELATYKAQQQKNEREYELLCLQPDQRQTRNEQRSKSQKPRRQGCSSDYDCGLGSHCVKPAYQAMGICMKTVDENGLQQYDTPRPNSVHVGSKQCTYDTDCPVNFRCDSKYNACVKR